MKERDLARRLRIEDVPEPPVELLERIRDDIPAELPGESRTTSAPASKWGWLLAASLVAAVGGGYVAWRLSEDVPRPAPRVNVGAPEGEMEEGSRRVPEVVPGLKERLEEEPVPGPQERRDRSAAKESAADEIAAGLSGPRPGKGEAMEDKKTAPAPAEPPAAEVPTSVPPSPEEMSVAPTSEGRASQQEELQKKPSQPRQVGSESKPLFVGGDARRGDRSEYPAPPAVEEGLRRRLEREPRAPVGGSTGGTAEPNDQPYGDVFFRAYGTNPFIDTEDDPLSTFGVDVDTGSYTVVRRYLEDGHLPPPEAVRVEELINYFDYGDRPPATGDFALGAEGAPSLFGEGPRYYLLRFSLRARVVQASQRRSASLTFVVDVSGSMARENRLDLVKESLHLLLDQLREDDRVALVVYGSRGRVLLEPTADLEALRRAIEELVPEGSTNAEEGLRLGYELAARSLREEGINRVILCSDGVANVGRTGAGSILKRVESEASRGIELTTLGFGMGNYNDVLMEQLADRGNGRYAYIDNLGEARRVLVEELAGTLQTVAADAKVQVEFEPAAVSRYRLLGYENRDVADQQFRDDTVDAGEIGAGHAVTALYEIKLRPQVGRRAKLATLHLRYRSAETGEVVEISRSVTLGDVARRWEEASPGLRLASLVAEYGELLKSSYWAKQGSLQEVFRRAQELLPEFPGDTEVADFVALVGRAARLRHGPDEEQ